ncbi:hypothetical protein AZI86_15015 [Bdellovibrio bacteriovorus]|uniref:Cytoplasmic protein n=1 Tax=Bdellovibrio bacteriovorus TaxID=959 RepID=A0A150WK23_BDEBC|nr:YheU family protein [Bdellovibrio bacteriovorus]KYG64108.1 hypothetical protein AZI86_15015 [Bdellovibrio bacteriovorus]
MEKELPPIEIPSDSLSEDALKGVIDNFVQREGTDYGAEEIHYETKIRQVQRQIEKGDVVIVFDPNSESVHLVTKHEFRKLQISANA